MDSRGGSELVSVYQPVVDLESGRTVGYEALARGPQLAPPTPLLEAARKRGQSAELDWCCREAAFRGALAGSLGNSLTLFVNIEPDTPSACPPRYLDLIAEAGSELRIVLEVTERAVVETPGELLRLVDWARERSWGIALDDIGENPASLAMMPFLEPDVIKLDLRLVQQRPTSEIGLIMSAVLAQAEHTGAVVLAEGVEDDDKREAALALGATLGQGWLYGRPAPLPADLPPVDHVIPLHRSWSALDDPTPFTLVRAALPVRRASRQQVLNVAAHLEEQAVAWEDGPVVLSSLHLHADLDAATADRYNRLAARGSFVAALRPKPESALTPGVRTATLPDGHPLGEEWSLVVVGPHYAGALIARQVGPAEDQLYDHVVTHQRDLVVEVGRALLRHIGG